MHTRSDPAQTRYRTLPSRLSVFARGRVPDRSERGIQRTDRSPGDVRPDQPVRRSLQDCAEAGSHLGFQPIQTKMTPRACRNGLHDAWVQRSIGNELFLQRFNVDVGEVNVEEFYAADLLQLLLYPATDFEAIFQAPSDRLFVVFLIGVKQLQ